MGISFLKFFFFLPPVSCNLWLVMMMLFEVWSLMIWERREKETREKSQNPQKGLVGWAEGQRQERNNNKSNNKNKNIYIKRQFIFDILYRRNEEREGWLNENSHLCLPDSLSKQFLHRARKCVFHPPPTPLKAFYQAGGSTTTPAYQLLFNYRLNLKANTQTATFCIFVFFSLNKNFVCFFIYKKVKSLFLPYDLFVVCHVYRQVNLVTNAFTTLRGVFN